MYIYDGALTLQGLIKEKDQYQKLRAFSPQGPEADFAPNILFDYMVGLQTTTKWGGTSAVHV